MCTCESREGEVQQGGQQDPSYPSELSAGAVLPRAAQLLLGCGCVFPLSRPSKDPSMAVALMKPAAGCCPEPRGVDIAVLELTRCMSCSVSCSSVPCNFDFS